MRQQWGNDEGKTHAQQHRAELVECMRWPPKQLDAFNPDLTPGPWRVTLVASASWSHSFFAGGTSYFHPRVEADRLYFDAMVAGHYEFWRKTTPQDIEHHAHQETLNWLLMLGAMAELGGRMPQEARFVEPWLANANKVFAVFRP
jgi:hypothetical protein